MDSTQIIERLHRDHYVEKLVAKLGSKTEQILFEDIAGDLWLMVAEKADKMVSIEAVGGMDAVRKYVFVIVHNQLKSKTSTIYFKWKKKLNSLCYIDAEPEEFEGITTKEDTIGTLDREEGQEEEDKIMETLAQKMEPVEAYIINTFIECGYDYAECATLLCQKERFMKQIIRSIIRKYAINDNEEQQNEEEQQ